MTKVDDIDNDDAPAPAGEDLEAIHKEALEDFKLCQDAEADNRKEALDDILFARLGKQWHDADMTKREKEGRPCMTINKMPAFIRQVVNDGRQNKPAIKVHPADDQADPKTAEVINGLIRNIEYTSKADVAYDTGLDYAATCGIGYWGVDLEYSHDDSFEMDIVIVRKPNPFAIYGDYASTAADSSDWNRAFEVDTIEKADFERKYKGKEKVDWDSDSYKNMPEAWRSGKQIQIASYWRRREVEKTICLMSDGRVMQQDWLDEKVPDVDNMTNAQLLEQAGITCTNTRESRSYEVTQYIMNGVEILKAKKWAGKYIPLVPVYGEELNVEGKRYFRSLIRDAKDAQRNFNYWRTTCTELVALAPKAPFIGPVGSFVTDSGKWETANTQTHPFIEYDMVEGAPPPERQPFAGVPAGALQEALNASDDMKAVMGMYDAALGARSNETSGRAINARKSESDNGTFHFQDNQSRAIRHTGVIIIDLIPHSYSKPRVIRVMGIDKKPQNIPINQPIPPQMPQQPGQPPQQGQVVQPGQQMDEDGAAQIYDLTVGKYDLTVDTGPGFQTKREEAAYGMTELMRAFPPSAAVIGPHLAKAQDWPGAEEIGDELAALAPGGAQNNPAVQQAQEHIQQLTGQLQQVSQQAQQLDQQLKDKSADRQTENRKLDIEANKADTDRIKALGLTVTPEAAAAMGFQTAQMAAGAMNGTDITPGGEPMEQIPDPRIDQLQQQVAMGHEGNAQSMAAVMEEMRNLRKIMSAPRKRTLIRGDDGRAMEAHDEIVMPEEQPQAPQQPNGVNYG